MPPEAIPVDLWKLLISGSPGVAALMLIFYIVIRELPLHRAAITDVVKSFREEMKEERDLRAREAELNRASRHESSNALQALALSISELRHDLKK